jgi:hypothetical protein
LIQSAAEGGGRAQALPSTAKRGDVPPQFGQPQYRESNVRRT